MGSFLQDVRYGARSLLKSPGFTLVAVLALGLGIGANSAIFSVVNAVLLRPLPYNDAGRLFTMLGRNETLGAPFEDHSYPNFRDVRERCGACEQVATYKGGSTFLTTPGEEPERLRGIYATADLFPALGARPQLGRVYTREEDEAGRKRVMVISHGLWQRRFGGDPSIIGREVPLGGSTTIVGVMPKGFRFPADNPEIDYWASLTPILSQSDLNGRDNVSLNVILKTRADVTARQAQAEIETIARSLQAQYPETNTAVGFTIKPLHDALVGDLKTALYVLLGAVGFVLLIACANVANLLLARAASRSKEISIRTALGASRGRIMRQLLTESLMLSAAGGALGLLLAAWGVDLLSAASPAAIPRVGEVGLDSRVVVFTVAVSVLTGLVFGLAPALQASKADVTDALKEGGRGGSEGARRNRLRSALVVVEVALSLVLLVCAGLLGQSFLRLLDVSPGFDPSNLLTMDIALRQSKYPRPEDRRQFFEGFLARARTTPGVQAVALIDVLPLGGSFEAYTFSIEGRQPYAPGQAPSADRRRVSHDYHRTLGIPVVRGRAFNERDDAAAPPVLIVNETFARLVFPGEDPLGKRIGISDGVDNPVREIVGVAGDVRHAGLESEAGLEYYVPAAQAQPSRMTVVARTAGVEPSALAGTLRALVRESDKESPIFNVRTMEELLARSVAQKRFSALLLGSFALVALLLAALGIYGVMAYSVTQRTHEIGVRVALGAQPRDVLRMVIRQGMLLTAAGIAAGLLCALLLTRVLSTLLFGIGATDPLTFLGVAAVLASAALVACYLPARRATKVDPLVALRYE
jgi:predicted permease